ncbi:MAG: beta-glucuronidase, partial [Vallitaleaceae bacterium]|nr:beta-glucuronidase [Vallitaleaceae bacterium]
QWENLVEGISRGERILYFPPLEEIQAFSIEGTYCTDFWCYPMFRSISESVNRPIPVGTMGLLVQQEHPLIKNFATRKWSTPQWWSVVEASRMMILDETRPSLRPVVQSIDNFERNHKLGLLWEVKIGATKVLICSCDHRRLSESLEGRYFLKELYHYLDSSQFQPNEMLTMDELKKIFKNS